MLRCIFVVTFVCVAFGAQPQSLQIEVERTPIQSISSESGTSGVRRDVKQGQTDLLDLVRAERRRQKAEEEQERAQARHKAELGDADAQFRMGVLEPEKAVFWWRKAAEQGHADAQHYLGFRYQVGDGLIQDFIEAVGLYRMAANKGLAKSQYFLGRMYENGQGVETNYVVAHMWFNLAAAQGYEMARWARDEIGQRMTTSQVNEAQRLAREWMAERR